MDAEPPRAVDDPRVYLAAERTYLAWARTSLGLIGFGFLIARFGYLIRQLEAIESNHTRNPAYSSWLGGAITLFGVGVGVIAAARHRAYVRDLRAGVANPELPLLAPIIVAVVLAIAGLAMTYLILTN